MAVAAAAVAAAAVRGGEGIMAQSLRFLRSVRPSGRHPGKNESFITISRLARLTDVTAGHQIP